MNGEKENVPRIVVSVVYSYAIIIEAALSVQKQFEWGENCSVKDLVFSSHWVKCFLNRAQMRRRKITTEDKKIPDEDEVIRIMKIGQDLIREFKYEAKHILNMDETAFTYAIGPEYIYVPVDQSRAQNIGVPNMKLRITAVVGVFGTGDFAPLFIIIKHSVSSLERPDQSRMTVIVNLHKKNDGFGSRDGWHLILWQKNMTINGVTADHSCYYIINKETGAVITSQHKAWNDTVRMIMWLEIIIKPLKEKLGKLLIWFDNCGCHKTDLVEDVINNLQIQVACLPPNMTGVLQVLDLVVNGPLKAHSRKLRGSRIVASFQDFAKLYNLESQKNPEERKLLLFEPPKPCMFQGINDLFELFATGFRKAEFQSGVVRSFISTGCLPLHNTTNNDIDFVSYTKQKVCGTMKIIPSGTRDYLVKVNRIADEPVIDENQEIIRAMNAFLDYDSDEDAMNAVLNF